MWREAHQQQASEQRAGQKRERAEQHTQKMSKVGQPGRQRRKARAPQLGAKTTTKPDDSGNAAWRTRSQCHCPDRNRPRRYPDHSIDYHLGFHRRTLRRRRSGKNCRRSWRLRSHCQHCSLGTRCRMCIHRSSLTTSGRGRKWRQFRSRCQHC